MSGLAGTTLRFASHRRLEVQLVRSEKPSGRDWPGAHRFGTVRPWPAGGRVVGIRPLRHLDHAVDLPFGVQAYGDPPDGVGLIRAVRSVAAALGEEYPAGYFVYPLGYE